jgi:hypothetical protein
MTNKETERARNLIHIATEFDSLLPSPKKSAFAVALCLLFVIPEGNLRLLLLLL